MVHKIVLFIHIISVVFMAWPLYALITVNERPKVSAPVGDKVDDFMEGILKKIPSAVMSFSQQHF